MRTSQVTVRPIPVYNTYLHQEVCARNPLKGLCLNDKSHSDLQMLALKLKTQLWHGLPRESRATKIGNGSVFSKPKLETGAWTWGAGRHEDLNESCRS